MPSADAPPPDPAPPPALTREQRAEAEALYRALVELERLNVSAVYLSLHRPYRVRPVGKPIALPAESPIISTTS